MLADQNSNDMQAATTARQRSETENRELKESLARYQKNEQMLSGRLTEYTEQLRSYH